MGKTSASNSKQKEKRLARKQEQHKIADGMSSVTAANKLKDIGSMCSDLLEYRKGDLDVKLCVKKVGELDKAVLNWAIDLTERNMKTLYENCAWGWNRSRKVEEMSDDMAWYVIAKDTSGKPLAFSHFRFDMDFGEPVLYCYEVQIETAGRRRGLGARLLQVLEHVSRAVHMKCVRLTVLTHNPGALAFFNACGYTLDHTSPAPEDAAHYQILSKSSKLEDEQDSG